MGIWMGIITGQWLMELWDDATEDEKIGFLQWVICLLLVIILVLVLVLGLGD